VTPVTDGGVREPPMPRVARKIFCTVVVPLLLAAAPPRANADDLAEAKVAVQKKDWIPAYEHLAKVLAKDAANREAALLAAKAAEEGRLPEAFPLAEDALHALLKKDAKDREGRLALGRTYLARGRVESSDPGATSAVAAYFADASDQFQKVLDGSGGSDEEAAAGLVEVHFWRGDHDKALAAADALLAKAPKSPRVSYWKGEVLYLKALDAFRAESRVTDAARALFERAKGAYEATTLGDASFHDAWMKLAYAAQYLGGPDNVATAEKAYEKAIALDPTNEWPVKGLSTLLANDPPRYAASLARLAKEHPKNGHLRWYYAYHLFSVKKYDEATKILTSYVKEVPNPDGAWVLLGRTYAATSQAAKAKDAFEAALKANPANFDAAAELEKDLYESFQKMGGAGPKASLDLVKSYEPLLAAAPKNPYIRNNLGFTLREALNAGIAKRTGQIIEVQPSWLPVLQASVRVYLEAADAIGEWRPEHANLPWATRYAQAGIVNDAGLMLWFYPQVRDVDRARDLYSRALEFTDSGHRDACMNLVALWSEQGDKDAARQVAEDCSERLMDEKGQPDEAGRAAAKKLAESLN
jgi:tetratricopeptide (TPR) repeat protein